MGLWTAIGVLSAFDLGTVAGLWLLRRRVTRLEATTTPGPPAHG